VWKSIGYGCAAGAGAAAAIVNVATAVMENER
jgi:hypothetical protein